MSNTIMLAGPSHVTDLGVTNLIQPLGNSAALLPLGPLISYLLWTVCFSACSERGPINVVSYEMTVGLLKAVSQTLPRKTDTHLPPSPPPPTHHIHHSSLSISPVTTVSLPGPTTLTAGLQLYNSLFLFCNSFNCWVRNLLLHDNICKVIFTKPQYSGIWIVKSNILFKNPQSIYHKF